MTRYHNIISRTTLGSIEANPNNNPGKVSYWCAVLLICVTIFCLSQLLTCTRMYMYVLSVVCGNVTFNIISGVLVKCFILGSNVKSNTSNAHVHK